MSDPTFPWVSAPFNGILDLAPVWSELSALTPVPLSGFLNLSAVSALIEFHGLVSCRNRSWTALLQSFPLVKIVYPSRGHWLPCSYPLCSGTHPRRPCHSRFHRLPRFWRSCLDPKRTMDSLFTSPKARFPVVLGHRRKDRPYRQLHLLRSFLPSTSPFALTRVSPSLVADALLVSCPSRDQTAQTLDPVPRLSPCRPTLEPSPEGSDPRLQGLSSPLGSRVKPLQHINALDQLRRQHPALFRAGPYRLSAAILLPRPFNRRFPACPGPRSLEVSGKLTNLRGDSSTSSGVSCLFAQPRSLGVPPTLAYFLTGIAATCLHALSEPFGPYFGRLLPECLVVVVSACRREPEPKHL